MVSDTALLVIEVQQGLFDKGIYQDAELLARLKLLIARASAAGVPVIYVQHSGSSPKHLLHPDKPGWHFHPDIAPASSELIIQKTKPDAFDRTSLRQELDTRGIRKLVIGGCRPKCASNRPRAGRWR
jgi:nicotinamidase-related amidase